MLEVILDCPVLILEIPKEESLLLEVDEQEEMFELEMGASEMLPYYTGDYEVTPRIYEQILETKNKSMEDDVKVYKIPKAEVANIYGTTVTIG